MSFQKINLLIVLIVSLLMIVGCRPQATDSVTIANSDKFSGLDTLSTTTPDSAADRLRTLIFNSLVKKNEKFEYVGDLAKDVKVGDDKVTVTFTLQDNVTFHNGKPLTSADVNYTLDAMFQAGGYKSGSLFDTIPDPADPSKKKTLRVAHIVSKETPDAKTFVVKVGRPALVNQLLSNLVAIPIVPEGTAEQQKTSPLGSGPFRFVSFDSANNIVQLASFANYWEGAPQLQTLTVKTVTDANSLQAELQAGRVDIAPNPSNFSAETFNTLGKTPQLQVVQTDGSNVRYIGFNVSQKPIDNVKLRQSIAFAIDRQKIISDLLGGQAKLAHSIIPENSWAYSSQTKYEFDLNKAKSLLKESGYKGEPIKFKIASGNSAVGLYAQVIQQSLKEAGINVEIETLENNTLLDQLKQGQFQMNTSIWVGGNQDPIFLRDLFASGESPDKKIGGRNRSRYVNPELDKLLQQAIDETDKTRAVELYAKAQEIVARDLPLFPLWYPANIVVANKRIGNIKINASGDWSFVKDLTVGSR